MSMVNTTTGKDKIIYKFRSDTGDKLTTKVSLAPSAVGHVQPVGRIYIAMATYNGEHFIEAQIASIQDQTFGDWVLLVRDDGSSDQTGQRVAHMARQDARIRLIEDGLGNQGVIGNFALLMEAALNEGAAYLFLADQDDIWQPEKLFVLLTSMLDLERQAAGSPLLVHSDLEVVDESLRHIAGSFTRFSRLSPTRSDLGVLLCQNQVTGCGSLFNRRLLELACPVPRKVLMHDWWLALLAAASGKIVYVPLPLVRYRQHGGNVLGAVSFWRRLWQLLRSSRQRERHIEVIKGGILQARLLADRLHERGELLSEGVAKQISAYARILEMPPMRRASILRRLGIGHSVMFALLIVLMKNDSGSKHIG